VTQMQPPPPPSYGPSAYYAASSYSPKPWSATAVTAFILSFLGCIAVPLPVALVLAVIGILQTSSGQRRGLGLAIAAIPISLVCGLFSIVLLVGVVLALAATAVKQGLPAALTASTQNSSEAARVVYEYASQDFREAVSEDRLRVWFDDVLTQHGKPTRIKPADQPVVHASGTQFDLQFQAEFVNGTVPLVVKFTMESIWRFAIDDIEIDGRSPRTAEIPAPNLDHSGPPPGG